MANVKMPLLPRAMQDNPVLFASLLVIVGAIFVKIVFPGEQPFPTVITDRFTLADWVNTAEEWLKDNFRWFTRGISESVSSALDRLEEFLVLSPWLAVMMILVLPALYIGGLRLGLLTLFGVMFWGCMDMWDSAMSTLSLMGISVLLSVLFGVLIGIACSQSNFLESALRPVLDAMQTMPAFVYLIPAIFFFGIGGAPAVLATMIYALPPVIRLTNLGIRQVPATTIEAAQSFGSTRLQSLLKVQIPLAMPSIMMGVNQTILMALGLVVLATFIGAGGLGYEVWSALRQLNVGWALEGGLCIVFMAIIFDRMSAALGKPKATKRGADEVLFHLLPQRYSLNPIAKSIEAIIDRVWCLIAQIGTTIVRVVTAPFARITGLINKNATKRIHAFAERHVFLLVSVLLIVVIFLIDRFWSIGSFPELLQFKLRGPVDRAVESLTVNPTFISFTKGLRSFVYLYMLNPLTEFLVGLPWWFVTGVFTLVAWLSSGLRLAVGILLILLFIGACGIWHNTMLTFSSVIVSVLICMVIGVPLGILTGVNRFFEAAIKPILDIMQVMPAFVYLIPVLMFFGGNIVSAVIATVIYALPPVIRLTALGIKQIPVELSEVSQSFGSTAAQTMAKLKLPMSIPSIMMGLNQAVMMALAMQVITPLIGGTGLGKDVFRALNVADTGFGVTVGLGIVLLAVVLDRLSQAWSRNQLQALDLD